MNIRQKLVLIFSIITIVPIIIIVTLFFILENRTKKTTVLQNLDVIADLKVDKIESFFQERRGDIESIQNYHNIIINLPIVDKLKDDRSNPEYIEAKETLDEQLEAVQKIYNYVDVVLINPEGKVIYTSNKTHAIQELDNQLPDPNYLSFKKGKEDVYFTDIFRNQFNENIFCIVISAPILNFEGEFIGVAALEVNMTPFYDFIQDTTGLGETGETLIAKHIISVSEEDVDYALFLNPLKHDASAALSRTVPFGDKSAFPIQYAVQGQSSSGVSTDYREEEILASWKHIPSLNWGLVTKIDTKEAFAQVIFVRNIFLIIGLIILILIIILAFWIAKRASYPISKLAELAEKISYGELNIQLEDSKRKDEIGILTRSFNKMANALREQEKEKAEFISSASHQLKTPATGVGFQLESLEKKLGEEFNKQEILNIVKEMEENNDRSLAISNDLFKILELGKYMASDKEDVNIKNLTLEVLGSLGENIEVKKIKTIINIPENTKIKVEREKFKDLLINLLDNAIKYSNENGEIKINGQIQDDKFSLEISDTGIGIPQKDQIHIFEKFFRASNSYLKASVGSGLGLVIVKIITEGHGGEISFTSKEEVGSTFKFTIPIK